MDTKVVHKGLFVDDDLKHRCNDSIGEDACSNLEGEIVVAAEEFRGEQATYTLTRILLLLSSHIDHDL